MFSFKNVTETDDANGFSLSLKMERTYILNIWKMRYLTEESKGLRPPLTSSHYETCSLDNQKEKQTSQ